MPSKKAKSRAKVSPTKVAATAKLLFWPVVALTLILWVSYRTLFDFPVWFDEVLGKAIFLGLPVWFFINMTQTMEIADAFSSSKLRQGLLQGIAFGGIYGFAMTILSLFRSGSQVQTALLFESNAFWWEFFLALMTGFWESLFFYAFVMTMIMLIFKKWSLLQQVVLTSLVFIIFHLPNLVALFSGPNLLSYILIIWAFGLGQAFIFSRNRNAYTLMISQAIWGMVLLIHVG